ncbi:MAG: insulinase family protein [Ignavibacteria bacterium]|nr:MAG: insulinase family protein [Ignavibacteria bacterium]
MKQQQHNAFTDALVRNGTTYRKTTLPGGLRIVTEDVPSVHSMAIGVWIDTGSRDEAADLNGISHFIEHAVFKGTRTRRTHHIAQFLESVGGYINAFTTKDSTCYYARVLRPHLPRAVHLLADLVQNPVFPLKEIEKEKQVIIEELRGAEDDPEDLVHEYFEEQLYGRHPLGQPIIGREKNILAFTQQHLIDFVQAHYTAQNVIIVAAGAVDHDQLVDYCLKEFSALPAGAVPNRRKPRTPRASQGKRTRPIQQTHLVLGAMTGGYHSRQRHSMAVLNTLLGEGMSSRLFQRVRERHGYAYNIYSFLSMYRDASTFGVYAGLERGQAHRARDLILRELRVLTEEEVSPRELGRARQQVVGAMLMGMESMTNRMTRIARDELVFGKDIKVSDLVEQVHRVRPEDIRQLSKQLFAEGALSEMLLEPTS